MRLDHEFQVPVPAAQAWPILLDIDRIAPCMPGATITKVDGDDFEGTVKVKVGPITVTYGGTASFIEKDESARMAVMHAKGPRKVGDTFRHEGILGTVFSGRILEEAVVGPYRAIVPSITGQAWITGFASYVVDPTDPVPDGFTVGVIW